MHSAAAWFHAPIIALMLLATAPAAAQDSPGDATDQLAASLPDNDDPGAVISYARQQASAGDLLGAAATLEGALLAHPNAQDVRAVHAAILCRLDDRQGASLDLGMIDRHRVRPEYWADVTAACGDLRPARGGSNGFGWSGEIAAGVLYESNASGALRTQLDLNIPGLPVPSKGGVSAVTSARLNYKERALTDNGFFYAGAALDSQQPIEGPDTSFFSGAFRTGLGWQSGAIDWSGGFVFQHLRIFDRPYMTEVGGQAEIGWSPGNVGRFALRVEIGHQHYRDILALPPGQGPPSTRNQSGWDRTVALEYQRRSANGGQLLFGIAYDLKSAVQKFHGYDAFQVYGAYQAMLTRGGIYALLSGTYRKLNYRSTSDRVDERGYVRGAIGIPLTHRLVLEAGGSYTVRNSNLPIIADYDSVGGDARLIWRFGRDGER